MLSPMDKRESVLNTSSELVKALYREALQESPGERAVKKLMREGSIWTHIRFESGSDQAGLFNSSGGA